MNPWIKFEDTYVNMSHVARIELMPWKQGDSTYPGEVVFYSVTDRPLVTAWSVEKSKELLGLFYEYLSKFYGKPTTEQTDETSSKGV